PDGSFSLSLAANADYKVHFVSRDRGHAQTRLALLTNPPGETQTLAPVTLPAAVLLTGTVTLSSPPLPARGAHVMLLCHQCSEPQASIPIAEAVAGTDGAFTLVIPDPGIETENGGQTADQEP
ncbi:MAG: hypothetical protein MJE77_18315, partial [Proteobacteria bacterium]|nr:hypothetical protein [Pseudomonadota bacterium]